MPWGWRADLGDADTLPDLFLLPTAHFLIISGSVECLVVTALNACAGNRVRSQRLTGTPNKTDASKTPTYLLCNFLTLGLQLHAAEDYPLLILVVVTAIVLVLPDQALLTGFRFRGRPVRPELPGQLTALTGRVDKGCVRDLTWRATGKPRSNSFIRPLNTLLRQVVRFKFSQAQQLTQQRTGIFWWKV